MGGCLFETLRWDLKWDVLFETLQTFQTFQPITGVGYFKLSDETWKRGAIWNFWNLKLFKPIMGGCLFETFRWDLKQDILFEMFETWNFSNMSWELLIWNFQMRLVKELLFETFETWNFSNMSWAVTYLKLSDETWNEMCYLKLFKLFNPSQELVIWNFQIRLEVRCAIWNFSTFSNPS